MINSNFKILEKSIQNPEKAFDITYIKRKKNLIISEDPDVPNELQKTVRRTRDNITAIKVIARNSVTAETKRITQEIIHNIMSDLSVQGMNFSEFASYWAVNDISFSVYEKMTEQDKFDFVNEMVKMYISDREEIYKKYGYSDVSLQVRSDSSLHKSSGELGLRKVSAILDSFGFISSINSYFDFMQHDKAYLHADKDGKKLANEIIEKKDITFDWREKHEGKSPDFLIKIRDKIIILEHKHMKETGGGQDKQLNEIIDLISSSNHGNPNLYYISFLDGVLFNRLFLGIDYIDENVIKKELAKYTPNNKLLSQKKAIFEALNKFSNNYFVNTYGFKNLIEFLVKA